MSTAPESPRDGSSRHTPEPAAAAQANSTASGTVKPAPPALTETERHRLTRIAFGLALFTLAYNLAEGALSVWAGRGSGLTVMIGFGVDSFIESLVAILVALRLAGRMSSSATADSSRREFITLRAVSVSFILLAIYLVVEAVIDLVRGEHPEQSVLGIIVLFASLVVMPALWFAKARVGKALGDQLILSDAAETWICLLMTASALIGLGLFSLTGWGGFDAVASLLIAIVAVHEAREAWEGELEE